MLSRLTASIFALSAATVVFGSVPVFASEMGGMDKKAKTTMRPTHSATTGTRKMASATGLKTGRSVAITPHTITPRAPADGLSAAEAATFGYRGDGAYISAASDASVPTLVQAPAYVQTPTYVPAPAYVQAPAYVPATPYVPTTTYVQPPAVVEAPALIQPQPYSVAVQPAVAPYAGYEVVQIGRSVAIPGNTCSTPIKACMLEEESYVGLGCSCHVKGGQARGIVTP